MKYGSEILAIIGFSVLFLIFGYLILFTTLKGGVDVISFVVLGLVEIWLFFAICGILEVLLENKKNHTTGDEW